MQASTLDDGRDAVMLRRVAVSGAGGLIGSALTRRLRARDCSVLRLVRRRAQEDGGAVFWNPDTAEVDAGALEGVDAVVHLAGENLAGGRWTAARKRRIRDSRVNGTRLLAGSLAGLDRPPRVLVNASAIGFYGDRGDEVLDEDSAPGAGFLADLCREWEAATEPSREAGIRVVCLRIGVVLARNGGALARMLPAFRLGLGGPVGGGNQIMSWISLTDLTRAIVRLLEDDRFSGAVNGVAPLPVSNAELARALGRALGRPAVLPLPAFLIGLAFGEMGRETVLSSGRILPSRLDQAGFEFEHRDIDSALRHELRVAPS
jgi:uncharacterized protein (TIGR01777 family)